MDIELTKRLLALGANVEGALRIFSDSDELYTKYLKKFPNDKTMGDLISAYGEKDYEKLFTAAHTLKGVSGNLGLTPIYDLASELVRLLRADDHNIDAVYNELKKQYDLFCKAIIE